MGAMFQRQTKLFFVVLPILLFSISTKSAVGQTEIDTEKANDPTIITLMVLYTEDAKDWTDAREGGIDNYIARSIAYTNQVFTNSDLNVEVELVYSAMVDYIPTDDSSLNLSRLRNPSDGFMDIIHKWRDTYNADFVTLVGGGGRGYLPSSSPNSDLGFSVIFSSDHTVLAHELGHNFGFHHSRNQKSETAPPDGGIFEYSTGWRWKGNDNNGYTSVMTYPTAKDGRFDTTAPYYSNPDINFKGTSTGSYTGKYAPADNARTMREIQEYLAGYRGPANEGDSLALVSIFENTNGLEWEENNNWLSNKALRTWEGVSVLGRVITLDIQYNDVKGDVFENVLDLTGLWSLYLGGNDLSTSIPEQIYKLKYLRYFYIERNNISGNIPSQIGQLTNLKKVHFGSNNLSGNIPPEIGALGNLLTLDLSSNKLSGGVPNEFGNLSSMEYLDVSNNNLRGPIPKSLSNLKNLEHFYTDKFSFCLPSDQEFLNWYKSIENTNELDVMCEDVEPDKVVTQYPENNLQVNFLDIALKWAESENADRYHLQVSLNKNFADIFFESSDVTDEEYEILDLKAGKTYYWRVRAINSYLDGKWSKISSFTTTDLPIPQQIVLISPSDDSFKISLTPEFKWYASERAEDYTFQLSKDVNFSTLQFDTSLKDTTLSIETELEYFQSYYWRVQAKNTTGAGEWSVVRNFRTETPTDNLITTGYPNPFYESTTIEYQIARQVMVTIEVYDIAGRRVTVLHNQEKPPGEYSVEFNARNLSSGIYFVRLKTDDFDDIQALTLIR